MIQFNNNLPVFGDDYSLPTYTTQPSLRKIMLASRTVLPYATIIAITSNTKVNDEQEKYYILYINYMI